MTLVNTITQTRTTMVVRRNIYFELPTLEDTENHEFRGWHSYNNNLLRQRQKVTKKDTAYAEWYTKHAITFETFGGTNLSPVKTGTLKHFPEDPIKQGYTFAGWYLDQYYIFKVTPDYVFFGNLTVYAKWA